MNDDRSVDRVIDEAARRLTADAPSPALRGRVLARLGPRRPRTPGWVLPAAMAAPIALLVIAIAWRTSVRVAPQPVNSGARADVAASATVMPRASGYDTASTRTAIVEPAAIRPHRPVVRLPIDESRLDALAPAALDIPSIAVRRMAPAAPIAEPPLDVAPLDIAPLGESQGDR